MRPETRTIHDGPWVNGGTQANRTFPSRHNTSSRHNQIKWANYSAGSITWANAAGSAAALDCVHDGSVTAFSVTVDARVPCRVSSAETRSSEARWKCNTIGREHVCTPDTNSQIVCRLL